MPLCCHLPMSSLLMPITSMSGFKVQQLWCWSDVTSLWCHHKYRFYSGWRQSFATSKGGFYILVCNVQIFYFINQTTFNQNYFMLQLRVGNGEDFMPSRGRWNFNHKVVFLCLVYFNFYVLDQAIEFCIFCRNWLSPPRLAVGLLSLSQLDVILDHL